MMDDLYNTELPEQGHERDREYLDRLRDYYTDHRSLPSYNRLCSLLGLASRSAVAKVLNRLARQGFLERTPDEIWVPTRRFFQRLLADVSVPAGGPMPALDVDGQPVLIDEMLVKNPSSTCLLPVKGDSMIEAGILDGDWVVVEKTTRASPGDIVVAMVDNAFTLKTLAREGGQYVLQPANAAYPVIRPQGELLIFGVVVGLCRQYGQLRLMGIR